MRGLNLVIILLTCLSSAWKEYSAIALLALQKCVEVTKKSRRIFRPSAGSSRSTNIFQYLLAPVFNLNFKETEKIL